MRGKKYNSIDSVLFIELSNYFVYFSNRTVLETQTIREGRKVLLCRVSMIFHAI